MLEQTNKNGFDARWIRIMETTRKLFLRYGYVHTSMKAIADLAHVSKATLYDYWPTKQAMFNGLILWESLHTFDNWLQRVEADTRGGAIGHILAHGIAVLAANEVLRVLYSHEAHTLGEVLRERDAQFTDQRYIMGLDFVKVLQNAEVIRADLPAEHIHHMLTTISVGMVSVGEVYNPVHFPDLNTFADSLGEMIEAALAPANRAETKNHKSIMLDYLTSQKQVILKALLAIYQDTKGDHG